MISLVPRPPSSVKEGLGMRLPDPQFSTYTYWGALLSVWEWDYVVVRSKYAVE